MNKTTAAKSASTTETNISNTIATSSDLTKLIKCAKIWAHTPNSK